MRKGMRQVTISAFILALVAAFAGAAQAQTQVDVINDPLETNPPTGWTLTGLWKVDNLPLPGNPGNCLNYNDDLDYDTGAINTGTAQSPPADITGLNAPTLTFNCRFSTEPVGFNRANDHDTRVIRIFTAGATPTQVYEAQCIDGQALAEPDLNLANTLTCITSMAFHTHTIPLNNTWGNIYVRFIFDTVDTFENMHEGWFIDNFRIYYTTTGGGGGGGGGGTVTGPGYYDANGVYVGFPNGGANATMQPGPTDVGIGVETGSTGADGVYVGSRGSTGGGGGNGGEEHKCGFLGIEFLLPLALLRLARRRR